MNHLQAKSVLALYLISTHLLKAQSLTMPCHHGLNIKCRIKTERQVRRSFVGELDLNASEVEIVLDYFVYGRELFQPDELAFVEGRKPQQT